MRVRLYVDLHITTNFCAGPHWLNDALIRECMRDTVFYVEHVRPKELGSHAKITTLRTLTNDEARLLGMQLTEDAIPCRHARTGGRSDSLKMIPIRDLRARLPSKKSMAIVIKADEIDLTAKNPANKRWSCKVNGNDLLGKKFMFLRKDPRK